MHSKLLLMGTVFLTVFVAGCTAQSVSDIVCIICEGNIPLSQLASQSDSPVSVQSISSQAIETNPSEFRSECDSIPARDYKRVVFEKSGHRFTSWVDSESGQSVCLVKEKTSNPKRTISRATEESKGLSVLSEIREDRAEPLMLGGLETAFCIACQLSKWLDKIGLSPFQASIIKDSESVTTVQIVSKSIAGNEIKGLAVKPTNDFYKMKYQRGGDSVILWVDAKTKEIYVEPEMWATTSTTTTTLFSTSTTIPETTTITRPRETTTTIPISVCCLPPPQLPNCTKIGSTIDEVRDVNGCVSGYSCVNDGVVCTSNNECNSNYCVHRICRATPTYCGDSYCDATESCNTCQNDCGNCPNVTCNSNDDCISGYCVHSTCRASPAYCGDAYCDAGEGCDTCQDDCGNCPNNLTCNSNDNCTSGYCVHSKCRVASTYCGDAYCDAGESCNTCQYDCGNCLIG